jgi:hypothetical protein
MGQIAQGIINWMTSKKKWMKTNSIRRLSRSVKSRRLDKRARVLPKLNKGGLLLKGKLKNQRLIVLNDLDLKLYLN